jgi:predicted RNA-binding protein associated with RNAse of E/G family
LQPDAHTGDFIPWYVNIETPHVRTKFGFDIDDLCLDVVIDSSLKFALKDADDLAERAKIGIYEPAQVAAIRASAAAAIARIESRQPPFDGSWAGWRPDPSWRTPALLRGWDIVENTA